MTWFFIRSIRCWGVSVHRVMSSTSSPAPPPLRFWTRAPVCWNPRALSGPPLGASVSARDLPFASGGASIHSGRLVLEASAAACAVFSASRCRSSRSMNARSAALIPSECALAPAEAGAAGPTKSSSESEGVVARCCSDDGSVGPMMGRDDGDEEAIIVRRSCVSSRSADFECAGSRIPQVELDATDASSRLASTRSCCCSGGESSSSISKREHLSSFLPFARRTPFTMADDIRSRSTDLLLTSLQSGAETTSIKAEKPTLSTLAEQLEASIHAANGSTTSNEYRDAIRQRSLFLKKDNPQALIPALLQGTLSADDFANASHTHLQSPEQALSDAQLQQDNIQQSIGMASDAVDGAAVQPDQVANDSQENGASGQIGVAEDMLGGEGEFKARGQPKTGKANEGECSAASGRKLTQHGQLTWTLRTSSTKRHRI